MSEEEIIKVLEIFNPIDCGMQEEKAIQGLLDLYNKEKEKNKRLCKIICKVRNYSSGVVCCDKIEGKEYFSPRKNFTRQQLYKQFLEIQIILKGNYIFLDNEKFLKEIEEGDDK